MGQTCCLLCCGGGCKYLCCWCCGNEPDPIKDKLAFDMNQMIEDSKNWNTGDILLERSSDKFSSAMVQGLSGSEWTHVGLIYRDTKNNVIRMIEMISSNTYNKTDGSVPMKEIDDEQKEKPIELYSKNNDKNYIYKNKEGEVISFDEWNSITDKDMKMKRKYKYEHFMNLEISDHARWNFSGWKWNYCGHRPIDPPLNEDELKKFEEGMNKLENKQFDELIESGSQIGAGCDCCSFCGLNKCCNESDNVETRLEKLFCSELAAELLQRSGVMKKNDVLVSDEFVPGDFDIGREGNWINDKFKYGKRTYYYGGE